MTGPNPTKAEAKLGKTKVGVELGETEALTIKAISNIYFVIP